MNTRKRIVFLKNYIRYAVTSQSFLWACNHGTHGLVTAWPGSNTTEISGYIALDGLGSVLKIGSDDTNIAPGYLSINSYFLV